MEEYTKIIEVINTSNGNYILRVEKNGIRFSPGQFFSLGQDEIGINREYSVASSSDKKFIDFFIREVEGGSLSGKLRNLKKGDEIKILGPYGEFYLKNFDQNANYIFFATGTGIAPFISLIDSHNIKNYQIFHGVRNFDDIYNIKTLKNYNVAVSRGSLPKETENNFSRIVQGRINQFVEKLEVNSKMLFFLCGNSLMVSELYDILLQKKIKQDKIFTEIFF